MIHNLRSDRLFIPTRHEPRG